MVQKHKKYWIIVDHPHQLVLAIAISRLIKEEKKGKTVLLITEHEYLKYVKLGKYTKYFFKVYKFRRIGFPPPTMPVLKQLLASLLMFLEIIITKIKIKNLDVDERDVIIGLSASQIFESMMVSSFSRNKKVSIVSGDALSEELQVNKLRKHDRVIFSIGGFFFRLVCCPVFKLRKIDFLIRKGTENITDGVLFQVYNRGLINEYDKILLLMNATCDLDSLGNPNNNLRVTYFPFINSGNEKTKSKTKRITFFSMPFMKGYGIDKKCYVRKMNEYLNFLRKIYGERYVLEYRPHPQEIDEFNLLDLDGFIVSKDRKISEFYLLENCNNIKAVFSVCSTSSRSALNFGIDSYVFPKLFPINVSTLKYYHDLFGDVPEEFYLKNFKEIPKPIPFSKSINSCKKFNKDFDWALCN